MAKEITNADLLREMKTGFKTISEQVAKNAEAIKGVEQRLGQKINGVRNSLDNEILRRTEEFAKLNQRVAHLERLHGIEPKKKDPIVA